MKPEIAATGLGFPEGPVVLEDGRVVLCEEYGARLSVLDGSGVSLFAETGGAPNGATLGADDQLYVAQNGGVVGAWRSTPMIAASIQRVSPDGAVTEACTQVAGSPLLAPNDICFGPDGRLYFTDPAEGYDPVNCSKPSRIYAVDSGGEGELIVERDPVYTNGLGFSPTGELLWVESYQRGVYRLKDEARLLCTLPENHLPDGFAVAEDGRIFIATVASHGITILGPDGKYLGLIELDERAFPTNCAFQDNRLWITDGGVDFVDDHTCGRLWCVDTDARGYAMHKGTI